MINKNFKFEGFTDEEYDKLEEWYYKLNKENEYHGAIGGDLQFIITPTSLGEIIEAKCKDESITLRNI
jgi:hypothetical protein